MSDYQSMDKNALESELKNLKAEYEDYKAQGLKLNMATFSILPLFFETKSFKNSFVSI